MNDKLAIILVSADRAVLEMGLTYARNAISHGWLPEIRLYLFGPSEVTIATDPDLRAIICEIIALGVIPAACKWCSDKYNVSALLQELGCRVEYIGQPVSEAIRDGYVPMTW
ncbi:MAG: hypothetical protein ACYCYF_06505 [Anaerolineae bacterium]